MKLADNFVLFELPNRDTTMYPALLWDETDVVLVDAGLPGQLGLIADAMAPHGFAPKDITKLFITHQDMDHIGCARQLSDMGVAVYAHVDEAPFLEGIEMHLKLAAMARRLDELDEGERAYYDERMKSAPNFAFPVGHRVRDGEVVPVCGGIEIVHTPGHMPGHICLYLKAYDVLLAGDAANITDGKLTGPNPVYTIDMPRALRSFDKLKAHGASRIVCYHGGIVDAPNRPNP